MWFLLLLSFFLDTTQRQRANSLRQLFIERYSLNQRNVKQLLGQASKRKWQCDKERFPGNTNNIFMIFSLPLTL